MKSASLKFFIYPYHSITRKLLRRGLWPHGQYLRRLIRLFSETAVSTPSDADYCVVPINLIHFQFSKEHSDPGDLLRALPYLDRKRHILLSTGDFGQRSRSAYEYNGPDRAYPQQYDWLDETFLLLAFESTATLAPWDVPILPYVLPPTRWKSCVSRLRPPLRVRRDLRFSFSGVMSYPQLPPNHIRGGRLERLRGQSVDSFVGEATEARRLYGRLGGDEEMMRRSVFTLCPAGFGRWTFRFVQSLTFGSIPVLLSDNYVLPFASEIPWDDIVVRIPENQLEQVPKLLRNISAQEIRKRQDAMYENRHLFSERGVFDLILRKLEKLKHSHPCYPC
jgi:hypothetical protein